MIGLHPSPRVAAKIGPDPAVRNAALAALPSDTLATLSRNLRYRNVMAGENLWQPAMPKTVYFPLSGIISVALPMAAFDKGSGGHAVEVGLVGREAMVFSRPGTHGVALVAGEFASMPATQFAVEARQDEDMARIAALSCDFLMAQAQQLAVCNAHHSSAARLCRWLAQVADRMADRNDTGILRVTQIAIAHALGANRQAIINGTLRLRAQRAISLRRGVIRIGDSGHLRASACACYQALSPASWPFPEDVRSSKC